MKMELFMEIVDGLQWFTIFAKVQSQLFDRVLSTPVIYGTHFQMQLYLSSILFAGSFIQDVLKIFQ